MSGMNNIENLIHRLSVCNVLQIKQIMFKILDTIQMDCQYRNNIKNKVQNIKYPQWSSLHKIVKSAIKLCRLDQTENYSLYCESIIHSIESRMKYEDAISHILPPEQRPYSSYFSNYNKMRYQFRVRKLVNHIVKKKSVIYNNIISLNTDVDIDVNNLFDVVKSLCKIVERSVYSKGNIKYLKLISYLQALHASMLINIKPGKRNQYENFCGFRMCDVCWRFVAYSSENCCRCGIHDTKCNTAEYQKATCICNMKSKRKGNKAIEYLAYKFVDKIRDVFVLNASTELYYDEEAGMVGSDEAAAILKSVPETPNRHRLWELMQILSRTCRYIRKRGGNPCEWESVIETLDPPASDEPEAYRLQRQRLHMALCRDPTPFLLNLAYCEAWLRLHNVRYSLAGRGGARPNSGGARPGAGRPAKSGGHSESRG